MKRLLFILPLLCLSAWGQQSTLQKVGSFTGNGSGLTNLNYHTFYASKEGCALNSSVTNGGGTDDTAKLQGILNLATNGHAPLHLIVDGAALISTNLCVLNNTWLEFLPGAGLFIQTNSDVGIIRNLLNTNYTSRNIRVSGGILNGNPIGNHEFETNHGNWIGQGGGKSPGNHALWFGGCNGLLLENITVLNPRAYGYVFTFCSNVVVEGCSMVCTIPKASFKDGNPNTYGQDGLHFMCPNANFYVHHFVDVAGSDDPIAFNSDEFAQTIPPPDVQNPGRYTTNGGPTYDMVLDDILNDGCTNVIRFQQFVPANSTMTNITIRNYHGSPKGPVGGNVGGIVDNIVFEDWNLTYGPNMNGSPLSCYFVGGSVTFRNNRFDLGKAAGYSPLGIIGDASGNPNEGMTNLIVSGLEVIGPIGGGASFALALSGNPLFDDPPPDGSITRHATIDNIITHNLGTSSGNPAVQYDAGSFETIMLNNVQGLGNVGTFTGTGSGLTNLNASNLSSGTVPSARLAAPYGTYSNYTTAATSRTMNTYAGKVLLASGSATYTVTDSLVAATSSIVATLNAVDTTGLYVVAVPGSGSFTLTVPAAATANLPISWQIISP